MASGFSTKAIVFATALIGAFGMALGVFSPVGQGQRAHAAVRLRSDTDNEVKLGPPSRLPLFGPRYAPITLDLFVPFGHRYLAPILDLVLRIARENPDVRVLFHPVLGSEVAERGAEALFSLWQQTQDQPNGSERCFGFAETLANHFESLGADAEAQEQLEQAARAAKVDTQLLRRELLRRTQRERIAEIWQIERNDVRLPPETWINGRRLRGLFTESVLREEIERARSRAYPVLRSGVPLTALYEQLITKERSDPSSILPGLHISSGSPLGLRGPFFGSLSSSPPSSSTSGGLGGLSLAGFGGLGSRPVSPPVRVSSPSRLDIAGSPRRGPEVAPVTLTLIGSLDTYATFILVKPVLEAWSQHSGTVRLVFQHAPTTEGGRKVAQLLAQLGILDPDGFWRVFDGVRDLVQRRYMLRYGDIVELLHRQHIDVDRLERMVRDAREGETVRALLLRDTDQVQRLGLQTPVVLLNGRPLGSSPLAGPALAEFLSQRIDSELRRGLLSRLGNH